VEDGQFLLRSNDPFDESFLRLFGKMKDDDIAPVWLFVFE